MKEVMTESYSKQFKSIIDVKMNDHKRMRTYKRMKRFNLSINAKILSSKLMFKMKKNLHEVIKKFKIR